jgi:hypothetical protein
VEVCKVDALVYGELNDLVKEGQEREAAIVLTAVAEADTQAEWLTSGVPEHVKAWRAWGPSAARAREV